MVVLAARQLERPKSSIQGICAQWTKPVILAIWILYQSMWESRNETLHGSTQTSQDIKALSLDATVRRLYGLQDTFALSDQILFTLRPVEQRLQSQHLEDLKNTGSHLSQDITPQQRTEKWAHSCLSLKFFIVIIWIQPINHPVWIRYPSKLHQTSRNWRKSLSPGPRMPG